MLARAQQAWVLSGWVTADEFYGQNRTFRDWLAAQGVQFVLATRSPGTTDGWLSRSASSGVASGRTSASASVGSYSAIPISRAVSNHASAAGCRRANAASGEAHQVV